VKAVLHDGPCDGHVDDNLRNPAPEVYTCAEPIIPPDAGEPIQPGKPTPEITYRDHRYRLIRIEDDAAHYEPV
jgi:hypothetical protein